MPDSRAPLRLSPLRHRTALEAPGAAVRLGEIPFVGKFILRADPHEAVGPLRTALGLGLPFDALTSSTNGETSFLWLGPDEWMLITGAGEADRRAEAARAALAGIHHQLTDVSDYYTVIEVAGPQARELLMKLTTLDLHPRAFRPGMVAGSIFGRANAILWQPAEAGDSGAPTFHLFIRWSMADYLWCLLANAGREWGLPEQAAIKGERLTIA
jgi:sarcosine oxidase subunit gamma